MSKREDKLLVQDILESISRIQQYLKGYKYEQLTDDLKTQDAVIRNLLIIGEAAKLFSESFRSKNPHIPFKEMADLRNRLVHDYFGVNYDVVWDIIQIDLPPLQLELKGAQF